MKKIIVATLVVLITGSFYTASAQGYKTALGVRLSSSNAMQNNSVSFKQFISDKTAIEALFTFGDPLALGALLEFHKPLNPDLVLWWWRLYRLCKETEHQYREGRHGRQFRCPGGDRAGL